MHRLLSTLTVVRRRCGMTQTALAMKAGVTQSEVSLIESGNVNPRPNVLSRIAKALAFQGDPKLLLVDYDEYARSQS